MDDPEFPKPVEDVIATLVDVCRHQKEPEIVEVLEIARPRFEMTDYDNWNGGPYTYALMLEIPVSLFASVESKLQQIEEAICTKAATVCRDLSNDDIGSVTIIPVTSRPPNIGPKPPDIEVRHIWKDGLFRLFLSHISEHKIAVSKLKSELQIRGISAFVAHEDIEPSREWQNEIELALHSMHALAALLTPDFHASKWTDQELGFALGRGVLALPVRLGGDPYGFIGKVQGPSGSLERPAQIATKISTTLLSHRLTNRHMRRGIVSAFAAANSYASAINLSKTIAEVEDFTSEEKTTIHRACRENGQIFNATGVVARITSAIGAPVQVKAPDVDDIPF